MLPHTPPPMHRHLVLNMSTFVKGKIVKYTVICVYKLRSVENTHTTCSAFRTNENDAKYQPNITSAVVISLPHSLFPLGDKPPKISYNNFNKQRSQAKSSAFMSTLYLDI